MPISATVHDGRSGLRGRIRMANSVAEAGKIPVDFLKREFVLRAAVQRNLPTSSPMSLSRQSTFSRVRGADFSRY